MSEEINSSQQKSHNQVAQMLSRVSDMVDDLCIADIEKAARIIAKSDLVIAFGNGGSHAVASHLVGDLMLRPGPLCIAIGDNVVAHTAYSNDYSFEESAALALERICNSHGGSTTTVIVFSTSGESKNVMRIAKAAKATKCKVIAVFGNHLHRIEPYSDLIISVNGKRAGRIEVVHDAICHAIAEIVPLIMTGKM